MKKILPFNEKPSIRTCIHYAYPCAIMESKELAFLYVDKFNINEWYEEKKDSLVNYDSERIIISENGEDTDTVFWRFFNSTDEISVYIEYIKPMDFGRYIDLFLFDSDLNEQCKSQDKDCGVRWNPYGFFIKKDMYYYDTKIYKYVKLSRCDNNIYIYSSKDGKEWELVDTKEIPDIYIGKSLKIAIHAHFGLNQYNIWKYMNFIQMIFNEDNIYKGIYLDYYFFPRKNIDNSYSYFLNFLDTYYDLSYEILDCFKDWHSYLHWCIDHFYYVELCLDEYHVKDRGHYSVDHYNHYNIFYGYDDDKGIYYIMGYGNKHLPIISELSYDVLTSQIITSEKVVRYKYCPNDITLLRFNIQAVITGFDEYLNSIDSSAKVGNLLTEEPVIYGLDAIKTLYMTDNGRGKVLGDIRVAFCLKERYEIMKERIFFLSHNGYIMKKDLDRLITKCDELIYVSSNLLLIIIRKTYLKKEDDYINQRIKRLYEIDKDFCIDMLKCLKETSLRVGGKI